MMPAAIGVDLVDVATFGEQLGQEGSVFHQVFTAREWNAATRFTPEQGASSQELSTRSLQSLAARWAAKEAFIKAWSSLYFGSEDPVQSSDINWADIEVVCDRWGRPSLRFHGRIASALHQTERDLERSVCWLLSLSHDGNYAIAWVSANSCDLTRPKDFS